MGSQFEANAEKRLIPFDLTGSDGIKPPLVDPYVDHHPFFHITQVRRHLDFRLGVALFHIKFPDALFLVFENRGHKSVSHVDTHGGDQLPFQKGERP